LRKMSQCSKSSSISIEMPMNQVIHAWVTVCVAKTLVVAIRVVICVWLMV
jgi:hypothetical protein